MSSYASAGAAANVNMQTAGDQLRQSVTRLADGTLVAIWETTNATQDGSGSAIVMRRLDSAGIPIGGEIVVNAQVAGNQLKPQVSALANGGYVVTWETADAAQDGNGTAVKAQIFDASGVAVGGEIRVNTLAALNQQQPTVTGLADGGFVVAWQTTDSAQDGAGWALKGQRFDASGALLGGEFRINNTAWGSQNNADIASLANGGFVVTWQIGNSGSSTANARVFDANGVAVGNDISVANFGGEIDTAVIALADGGFAVAYGRGGGIFFQRFDAARVKVGGEVYVGGGFLPEIAALTEGGFVIGWRGGSTQMLARAYDAAGAATSNAFVLNTDVNAGVEGSLVALAGGGFASFSSSGSSDTGSGQDVRVQIFQPQANAAPELGAATRSIAMAENGAIVATITASDDGGPSALTYAISGGADAARFTINAATGALRFAAAPNYEAPSDTGANNVYDVIVTASDGALSDTQAIAVSVTNVNEAPVITSNGGGASAALTLAENGTAVTTVIAADAESANLSYAIAGGLDAARFAIDAATGVLTFVANPDFETPADSGGNNVYNVTVRASDGSLVDTQAFTITVLNADETPVITSSSSFSPAENDTLVGVVTGADPDGAAMTWSIAGGADAALFVIDQATGELRFASAPDFEAPGDADGDNVHDVVVRASDGTLSVDQALSVGVGNVNEGVTFTTLPPGEAVGLFRPENSTEVFTFAAADADGDVLTYTLSGADAALFAIDPATGAVSFVSAPDHEAPAGAGGANDYFFTVTASDGALSASRNVGVGVYDVNEGLSITSAGGGASATIGVLENSVAVATVAASDLDGDAPVFAIAGGADAAHFTIDAVTGALDFAAAPDFEAPGDADGDNVYDVIVSASDGFFADIQALAVTVIDAPEGNVITGNNAANTISTIAGPTGQPRATELEDMIYGLGGNDVISAAGGEDVVDGGAGSDKITGGAGADTLTGGAGADRFAYAAASDSAIGASDLLTDFNRSQGDRIDLTAIDARTDVRGNQSFTFIGDAAFSGVTGELRCEHVAGNTFVTGDVNGDGAADFSLQLNGSVLLTTAEFVL